MARKPTDDKAQGHWLFGLAACLRAVAWPLSFLTLGLFGGLSPRVASALEAMLALAFRALP